MPSIRHHLSCDDCLEHKRENNVLCTAVVHSYKHTRVNCVVLKSDLEPVGFSFYVCFHVFLTGLPRLLDSPGFLPPP